MRADRTEQTFVMYEHGLASLTASRLFHPVILFPPTVTSILGHYIPSISLAQPTQPQRLSPWQGQNAPSNHINKVAA
jgi:hypothetical protein